MRAVKEIIGSVKSTIKSNSRKGYQAIAKTASELKNKGGTLGKKIRQVSAKTKRRLAA
jgi:hypothetical protein